LSDERNVEDRKVDAPFALRAIHDRSSSALTPAGSDRSRRITCQPRTLALRTSGARA
jgi:hypothetical protein